MLEEVELVVFCFVGEVVAVDFDGAFGSDAERWVGEDDVDELGRFSLE